MGSRDQFYVTEAKEREEEPRRAKARPKRAPYVTRHIDHPLFKNASLAEAVAILDDREAGDCIIRPSSSRGPTHLTITLKVFGPPGVSLDAIYTHVDIKEGIIICGSGSGLGGASVVPSPAFDLPRRGRSFLSLRVG